jgi:hypothetical protein
MEKVKKRIIYNKPIYVGCKILDLSKIRMYDFWYNGLMPHFGPERLRLLATDTDSVIIQLETQDLSSDLTAVRKEFDFSNYAENHPLYDPANKRIPGYMKDEYPDCEIKEWVGLRSKCYAFVTDKGYSVKRAKGTKKGVVKKEITFEDYVQVLEEGSQLYKKQRLIRSKKQALFTIEQEKRALSGDDDKRFICQDGINTLPWGHWQIEEPENDWLNEYVEMLSP